MLFTQLLYIYRCYWETIKTLLKHLGFEDILIELDVVAPGSIKGVIEEKHYNRAERPHKIVSGAVWRPKCESFGNWLTLREDPVVNDMEFG